jgi:phosphoglycolate phosphatase-like HAD superfamily hydrolase
MTKKIRSIIFDFDGVLMDSTQTLFNTTKHFLPEFTEEELHDVFKENAHNHPTTKEIFSKHHDEFQQRFLDETKASHFFDGAKELIEKLENNYQLFINTSAPTHNVVEFLKLIGKEHSFEKVYGADIETSKVKKFEMIVNKYNLKKEECLFITDTLGDLRESKIAEIKSIAVTWGVHFRNTLEQGESIAIVDTFEELLTQIQITKNYLIFENI